MSTCPATLFPYPTLVLSLDDTIAFGRGFVLFSMLANLAEGRQGVAAEPEATVAAAIEKLKADGIDGEAIAALLSASLVAPVLTAHPTEVRRKDRKSTRLNSSH